MLTSDIDQMVEASQWVLEVLLSHHRHQELLFPEQWVF